MRTVTRFVCLALLGTGAHGLELLVKLMPPLCMLIAWIESHDPDVKKVGLLLSVFLTDFVPAAFFYAFFL